MGPSSERPSGSPASASEPSAAPPAELLDLRLVLADDDPVRAEAIAHDLRSRGAEVLVTDLEPSDARLSRMRAADPAVLLVGEAQLQETGYALVRRMQRDARLRWTSLLLAQWSELWRDDTVASDSLSTALRRLVEPERELRGKAASAEQFESRLEIVGPARTLRALGAVHQGLRVTVSSPRLEVELDLADGLVVGALARPPQDDGEPLEGTEALAGLLQLDSGRVEVTRVAHPARANVMASLDMALGIADGEAPALRRSPPVAEIDFGGPPSLPSIPVSPWSPGVSGAPFSLRTSASESPAPPPQLLPPAGAAAGAAAPPSLELSPIDHRLRAVLQVDDSGPSPSLLAVVGCLMLLQLLWIGLLVASSIPSPGSPLVPVRGAEAPLAEGSSVEDGEGIPSAPALRGAQPQLTPGPEPSGPEPPEPARPEPARPEPEPRGQPPLR